MTDEYETKLLAEDWAMALHIQEKCKFETLIADCRIARKDASDEGTKEFYDAIIDRLDDCRSDINELVKWSSEAARSFPSSRDLGEVCSKKKMGAVG